MKRSQPRRDWSDARAKAEAECCRVCGYPGTESAHLYGRRADEPRTPGNATLYVHPDSTVPLCKRCHAKYDEHQIDLLGHLSPEEEARAVLDAGGLELARRRLAPSLYGSKVSERRSAA